MSTTPPTNALLALIAESHVEASTATALRAAFEGAFEQALDWANKARTIQVTDASQLKEMKLARESRLALRKVRTDVDKKRKELKADVLAYGRAIDGCAKILADLIEPTEEYLLKQEEFAKRIEAQRIEEMKQARIEELTGWGVDTQYLDLGGMPDSVYQKMLTDAKAAHEARLDAQRKAEAEAARIESERIAREKAEADARELQRLENERLKREAEERQAAMEKERAEMEAKLAEERRLAEVARKEAEAKAAETQRIADEERRKLEEKAEYERQAAAAQLAEQERKAKAERDALEAKQRAEQAKRDAAIKAHQEAEEARRAEERAKAREEQAKRDAEAAAERARLEAAALAERDAREKLENAARIKAAEEAAAKKAADAAAKKAAKAPDKTKLIAFAAELRTMKVPVLTTEEGKAVQTLLADQITKFAGWVDGQAAKL